MDSLPGAGFMRRKIAAYSLPVSDAFFIILKINKIIYGSEYAYIVTSHCEDTAMVLSFDSALRKYSLALKLREQFAALMTASLASLDTPNCHAPALDFRSLLQGVHRPISG